MNALPIHAKIPGPASMVSTHSLVCVTWTIMDIYAKTVCRKAYVCGTVNISCLKQYITTTK